LILTEQNHDLTRKNETLSIENSTLIQQVATLTLKSDLSLEATNCAMTSDKDDFKVAEARSKLARALQNLDDLTLIKDFALKQLEQEKLTRIHVEKERDAYMAAYEASLTHFDKWSRSKS
jgi:hypothetical protein